MPKPFRIEGESNLVMLYSVKEVATLCKRGSQTIRKWEKERIIPPATIRDDKGWRWYTEKQAKGLAELVKKYVKQGVSLPEEFKKEVWELFAED